MAISLFHAERRTDGRPNEQTYFLDVTFSWADAICSCFANTTKQNIDDNSNNNDD
jgi:hypothetical protein